MVDGLAKNARKLLCSLLLLLGLQTGAIAYDDDLQKVAEKLIAQLETAGQARATVLDFTDLQGQQNELGRFLAQELSDKLIGAAKSVSFLDRAGLQYLLKENKLSAEGLVNPETTRKLGNLIGVDTLIVGTATPLGKKIRLSVRAIAVETGKIVGSQSVTLPPDDELLALYTHGVAQNAQDDSISSDGSSPTDARGQLRADSFRLTGHELIVAQHPLYNEVKLTFGIENLSGLGVGMGLKAGGISAGPCIGPLDVSGLPKTGDLELSVLTNETDDPSKRLLWLAPSAKASVTVTLGEECAISLKGVKAVPLTASFVVAKGKDVIVVPVSIDELRVRWTKG
ncbi:FlgO family outer membrane protein [Mesorhizobium sp. M1B.F.Ca.ET.045.04.1.1]|uniref:FlgO family outer membrane protein n=1 Tax=Mesorhizobium sp. M1B.F.Ca.ET.045.04.1.1 TaxID=2493673 RepID=UPI000F759B8E|nr:FlgO family outer membrane protein [Mesorhizobium sp. M1B.F.Ca.ET.045.04.1.1]AZO32524.1 hypothetical protein EJ071_37900 [Mesorhizobium sp. M1B.F.Ca.ET.045.04.1.1]